MTKTELKGHLLSGKTLEELFKFRSGQECLIFKAPEFQTGSDILYIPDLSLREIPIDAPVSGKEDIEEILSDCYSGDDFIRECGGNQEMASCLFDWCDWQSPSSAAPEVVAAYADDPTPAFFG